MQPTNIHLEKLSTAVLLKRQSKAIIDLWASRVRALLPAAQKQREPELLDALPDLMDQIVNALSLVGFESDKRQDVLKEHAIQRSKLEDYTLKGVLTEMRILRETIFEVLEKNNDPLVPRDRDIILETLERGIITTSTEYMRLEIEDVETTLDESISTIEKLETEQRLRDLFVSTLTHDLRTPLSAALLSTGLLRRAFKEGEDKVNLVNKIETSLFRMDGMIEVLLDANHMRAGQPLTLEMKKYDLRKQVTELLDEIYQGRGKKIIFKEPEQPVICQLAQEKIRRAIENLLTNAIKYGAQEKDITVTITKSDDQVRISVHNYGKPIPVEDQKAIFEPFFRSKSVRLGNQKGWGLGLTLVQGIVEAHGGHIDLVSNAAEGTTFSIVLPFEGKRSSPSSFHSPSIIV